MNVFVVYEEDIGGDRILNIFKDMTAAMTFIEETEHDNILYIDEYEVIE